MDFERIVRDVEALGLNLYDFAMYTPQGVYMHRFQRCSNCLASYSVAKLFVVTALGMLYDEGKIRREDPVGRYIEIPAGASARWQRVTVGHAVTHRIGFDEGFLDIDTEDAAEYPDADYLVMVFNHPLAHEPGEHEQYTDAAYYLLSRLVSAVAGETLDAFLRRRLLQPLSFREAAWSCCPLGHPIGATGLYIGAQDMVKLAALYLEGGAWKGKRILSGEWVRMAMEREYELHPYGGGDMLGKCGMYGQAAVFSEKLRCAFAWHAHEKRESMKRLEAYFAALCEDMK